MAARSLVVTAVGLESGPEVRACAETGVVSKSVGLTWDYVASSKQMKLNTFVVLGFGILAVSTAGPLVKSIPDVPYLAIASLRLLLAAVIVTPVAWYHSRTQGLVLTGWGLVSIGLASVCLALHFSLWIASLQYTSVASSVVLVTMNPLFLAFAGYYFYDETLRPKQWAGIFLGVVGAVCIGWHDFVSDGTSAFGALRGDLLALAGGVMMCIYLLCGRCAARQIVPLSYACLVYWGAAIILIATSALMNVSLMGYSDRAYIVMVLLALLPQALGHTILNWALAFLSPTLVAIALLGEPIGAMLMAWCFLDERIELFHAIGIVVLLSGIVLGQRR